MTVEGKDADWGNTAESIRSSTHYGRIWGVETVEMCRGAVAGSLRGKFHQQVSSIIGERSGEIDGKTAGDHSHGSCIKSLGRNSQKCNTREDGIRTNPQLDIKNGGPRVGRAVGQIKCQGIDVAAYHVLYQSFGEKYL